MTMTGALTTLGFNPTLIYLTAGIGVSLLVFEAYRHMGWGLLIMLSNVPLYAVIFALQRQMASILIPYIVHTALLLAIVIIVCSILWDYLSRSVKESILRTIISGIEQADKISGSAKESILSAIDNIKGGDEL